MISCWKWHYFILFLWLSNILIHICVHIYIYIYAYCIFFIHSSDDRQLYCLNILATINNAAVNIGVRVSFWITVSFRYIPRTGIAGSYGNVGDLSLIPGLGRFPGKGNPHQYSYLISMERGNWCAEVHGVTKSWTWLSD